LMAALEALPLSSVFISFEETECFAVHMRR